MCIRDRYIAWHCRISRGQTSAFGWAPGISPGPLAEHEAFHSSGVGKIGNTSQLKSAPSGNLASSSRAEHSYGGIGIKPGYYDAGVPIPLKKKTKKNAWTTHDWWISSLQTFFISLNPAIYNILTINLFLVLGYTYRYAKSLLYNDPKDLSYS